MSSELSEELLAIAEQVCRVARECGKPVFNVCRWDSDLWTEREPGATANEMENWLT